MVETIQVYWPAKFGEHVVGINVTDFDPKLHKRADGRPVTPTTAEESPTDPKPQPRERKTAKPRRTSAKK